jgi:hypothetical protein
VTDRTNAARQKRWRDRRRRGVKRIRLDLIPEVLERMIAERWTDETELGDRQALGAALEDFLECWAEDRLASRYATLRTAEILNATPKDRE